jgi:hypothetical protein
MTTADGQRRSGTGLAHYEKNWGAAFPRYWVWAQGVDPQSGTAFVLAGGENPLLPGLGVDAWILGVRTRGGLWHFATAKPGQIVQGSQDSCRGRFTINAVGLLSRADIEITAPRESFSSMQAPTADGFAERSEQSFRGSATVRLTRKLGPVYGQPTVINIPNSALEFGGDWRCRNDR